MDAQLVDGLRDIRGPVYFPANYLPLIIAANLLVILLTTFLIIYLLKRRKRVRPVAAAPPRPPHEVAYEALDALKAMDLPGQGRVKEHYFALSDIARHYMEGRFNLKAPEMTTEEFLYSLRDSDGLTGAHKNLLKGFLGHCDMVKFAKYGPTPAEIEESFAAARRLVDETKMETASPPHGNKGSSNDGLKEAP